MRLRSPHSGVLRWVASKWAGGGVSAEMACARFEKEGMGEEASVRERKEKKRRKDAGPRLAREKERKKEKKKEGKRRG